MCPSTGDRPMVTITRDSRGTITIDPVVDVRHLHISGTGHVLTRLPFAHVVKVVAEQFFPVTAVDHTSSVELPGIYRTLGETRVVLSGGDDVRMS